MKFAPRIAVLVLFMWALVCAPVSALALGPFRYDMPPGDTPSLGDPDEPGTGIGIARSATTSGHRYFAMRWAVVGPVCFLLIDSSVLKPEQTARGNDNTR
jgi:hypothetical protein